jgi:hypothetical protein
VSYCYDVMERVWDDLQSKLPPEVRDGRVAMEFGFLIGEMHEANHRLKDAINKDPRVSSQTAALERAFKGEKE